MIRPDKLPRLFEGDPKAMEALDHLLANPEEISDHLLLAGGICQGREMMAAAAAVLIAADQLRRRGIL